MLGSQGYEILHWRVRTPLRHRAQKLATLLSVEYSKVIRLKASHECEPASIQRHGNRLPVLDHFECCDRPPSRARWLDRERMRATLLAGPLLLQRLGKIYFVTF